jgi:outer membrane protein assembly factor BamD (BamD/ComL family)
VPKEYAPEQAGAAMEEARGELEQGDLLHAFFRSRSAARSKGLSPEDKLASQALFDRATEAWIDAHSATGSDPDLLEELLELDVSTPLAVRAGVNAARLYYEEKERMKAFRLLKRVDRKFPHHQERLAAGGLLASIGFSFAEDTRRYGLIFHYKDNAPQVLEYLVLEYPTQAECDRAYFVLAKLYEEEKEWDLAIERLEDLVLWHSESPLVVESRARIPHLRLTALRSPEYDRGLLVKAREETEDWLARFPDQGAPEAMTELVRADHVDAIRRLADNDLVVARFYKRVDNASGAELHARRAVEEAHSGGEAKQIAEAQALLENILAMQKEGAP